MKPIFLAVVVVLAVAFLILTEPAFAQNVSTTQMQLANSQTFITRIQYSLAQEAVVVKAEALATACHTLRSAFATVVLTTSRQAAADNAATIVGGTNVIAGTIIANADPAKVDSTITDASLFAQIAAQWNALSKCDTGA